MTCPAALNTRLPSFLLTHPVWDVTCRIFRSILIKTFLLTHPVWDVTPWSDTVSVSLSISTHTSRVGCDQCNFWYCWIYYISTHTSRVGCDIIPCNGSKPPVISTHTSRVGCDNYRLTRPARIRLFLLTHPVWDVTCADDVWFTVHQFLLTHPVWDVTAIYSILQSQHPHISRDGLIIHLELY